MAIMSQQAQKSSAAYTEIEHDEGSVLRTSIRENADPESVSDKVSGSTQDVRGKLRTQREGAQKKNTRC